MKSARMYKDKLREWNFKKYKTGLRKKIMTEITKRGDHPTEVLLHGRAVPVTRVEKAYRKHPFHANLGSPESLLEQASRKSH